MIKQLDHIAIAVKDLEASTRFYEELGLKVTEIEEVKSQKVKIAFIPIGNTRIELVQPTSSDSPVAQFLEKRGEGLHHICPETNSITETLQTMKEKEMRLIDKSPREGAGGSQIAFVHPKTNSGVLTELVEQK